MPRVAQLNSRSKTDYAVHSVENALDLLNAICDEGGEAQVSQLSQRLGINRNSVFRLLVTFERRGFVERSDDPVKYRLGLSACEMGQKIIARMGVLRKARPAMERLARQCNEAVYFVVRRNDYVLMLDMVDTTQQQVKIVPLVGQRFPLLTTAAGRLFLAYENETVGNGRKRADAPGTVILPPLEREVIRNQGFSMEEQGFGDSVTCVAVPLLNGKGEATAALTILGPAFRMGPERIDKELLPQLMEAGLAISAGLGHVNPYLRRKSV
jgi:DNA-binding IclR family transcriptional regulator